jgi:hypothetical protein
MRGHVSVDSGFQGDVMNKVVIIIPFKLPGLNEYVDSCRANWARGARDKKAAQEVIAWCIKKARPSYISGKVHILFEWYEHDKRRDPDNIGFARKFILDALVAQHVIGGDGWRHLATPEPFTERFFVDSDNPRCVVTIEAQGGQK